MIEAIVAEAVTEAESAVVESVVEAAPVVAEASAGGHMGVHGRGCCCGHAGRADRSAAGHQNGS
ncbi:hypothetical protein ACIHEJ_39590 [Streptomyces sp. NPDC052301]|uniref:hypothetical protein n=1 Tax=Streptomyces sp. NPDC052301 TaxID=3365687 RepID=UPI0037D6F633